MVFVEEVFLCKKISKKDVYVDYGATPDILNILGNYLNLDSWQMVTVCVVLYQLDW